MTYSTQGLTIDQITYEALIVLKNKLAFGNRCLRQFDTQFGEDGAKIGDTLRVRVPPRFVSTTGPAPATQTAVETYVPVAAQTQRNILLSFTSKDLGLSIDDFRKRFIEPQMVQLGSDVDTDGTTVVSAGFTITNNQYVTANYAGTYAGFQSLATPGALTSNGNMSPWTGVDLGSGAGASNSAMAPFFQAQARLTEQGAPHGDRYCVICPAATACTVPNLITNQFNPQQEMSAAFMEGILGNLAGAAFYESPSVINFTSGTWNNYGAATNCASATANGTTVVVTGLGATATVVSGDQLVIAGVYAVNPLTRLSTNKLQVFTSVGAATASGNNVTLTVYPSMNAAPSGAQQTISALPGANAQVTFMGTSNTSTAVNFMYEKNAVALVVAPLSDDLPGAVVSRATDPDSDGLSVRYVEQYQGLTDQVMKRIDILYGWATVRPQLGCRIQA